MRILRINFREHQQFHTAVHILDRYKRHSGVVFCGFLFNCCDNGKQFDNAAVVQTAHRVVIRFRNIGNARCVQFFGKRRILCHRVTGQIKTGRFFFQLQTFVDRIIRTRFKLRRRRSLRGL